MKPHLVILECGHEREVFHPGSKIRNKVLVFCASCSTSKGVVRMKNNAYNEH